MSLKEYSGIVSEGDDNVGYYVTVESNVKIFVEDLNPGGDKTILFVHGWPGNHNLFEYQIGRAHV